MINLVDDLYQLPQFSFSIGKSLLHEVLTDPELLCLAASGLCLSSRSRFLKGIGIGLGGWFLTRSADKYMAVIDSKLGLLARVIDESDHYIYKES